MEHLKTLATISTVATILRDISPILIGSATLFVADRNIGRTIRKNRSEKWVEEFRKEVANVIKLTIILNMLGKKEDEPLVPDTFKELLNSVLLLRLYLDVKNETHTKLGKFIDRYLGTVEKVQGTNEGRKQLQEIIRLSKTIVEQEQQKV
jgi:hypothetical protein